MSHHEGDSDGVWKSVKPLVFVLDELADDEPEKEGKKEKKTRRENVHHRQELWSLHVSERFEVSSEPGFGLEVQVASAFSNMFFLYKNKFRKCFPKGFSSTNIGCF